MLSLLDFFALKAKASYMRVHGQQRGTAAKKAVCYNRRLFSSCNPGWAGNFQNQAGRIPSEEPGNRRKAHLVIDIFHYSPICLRIQAFSTFFPCFFGERRVVLGDERRWVVGWKTAEMGDEGGKRRIQGAGAEAGQCACLRPEQQTSPAPFGAGLGICTTQGGVVCSTQRAGHKKSPRTEVRGEQT